MPEPRSLEEQPSVEEQRRQTILEATSTLIAERGYHAVRVADIAKVCGTSTGTVHYYFPGKQDVLTEALKFSVENAFSRQSEELRGIADARERLLRVLEMQLPKPGQVRREWSIWLQFWVEASLRPELRAIHGELYARWRKAVTRIVQQGQRQGSFHAKADPEKIALELVLLIDGAAIQVLASESELTIDRMRDLLTGFVERELVAT